MMTTESLPSAAFDNWKLTQEHPYILGEFVWTAMDYLGESGIGSWSYATPEQAVQAVQVAAMMSQMMSNMGADGKNPFEALQQPQNGQSNPAAAMMKFMFPGFPMARIVFRRPGPDGLSQAHIVLPRHFVEWRRPGVRYRTATRTGGQEDRLHWLECLPDFAQLDLARL